MDLHSMIPHTEKPATSDLRPIFKTQTRAIDALVDTWISRLEMEADPDSDEWWDIFCVYQSEFAQGYYPDIMADNLKILQERYELENLECEIFAFVRLAHDHPRLAEAIRQRIGRMTSLNFREACQIIATALGNRADISEEFLGWGTRLIDANLVTFNEEGYGYLGYDFLKIFDCDCAPLFASGDMDFYTKNHCKIFAPKIRTPEEKPVFTPADFSHLPTIADVLMPAVKEMLRTAFNFEDGTYYEENRDEDFDPPPPNILIVGPKGAGKSALARMVADQLKLTLAEGPKLDEISDINKISGLYGLMLEAEENKADLIAVDDACELFKNTRAMSKEEEASWSRTKKNLLQDNRRHFRHILAHAKVPTFYLAEDVRLLDPEEFGNLFALRITVKCPEDRIRRDTVKFCLEDRLTAPAVEWLVRNTEIPLDGLERIGILIDGIIAAGERIGPEKLRSLLDAGLPPKFDRAKLPKIKPSDLPPDAHDFDPSLTNASKDLEEMALGFKRRGHGSICLYGPSGTGKSAYAAYLAQELERPLIFKNYSDLARSHVGDTERLIAEAFRETRERQAVLLIDEADSFLTDRTRTQHTWENTTVNEMLTQLQNFEQGYFIATTNLIDNMDPACYRRFGDKIMFDYLRPDQVRRLAQRLFDAAGLEHDEQALAEISKLETLTPGDFAALMKSSEILTVKKPEDVVKSLVGVCALKKDTLASEHRQIGFR